MSLEFDVVEHICTSYFVFSIFHAFSLLFFSCLIDLISCSHFSLFFSMGLEVKILFGAFTA